MANQTYLKDVVSLVLNSDTCTGCGLCVTVCPHQVFEQRQGKAFIRDRDACMECGACSRNCPVEAVTVESGVGCAAAVLSGMLSGNDGACCRDEPGKKCC